MSKKIGLIGAGNMAEALISGIIKSGINVKNIMVSDVNTKRLSIVAKRYRIRQSDCNIEIVKSCDIIFLAVKPYQVQDVLEEVGVYFNNKKLLISIAAGINTSKIEKYLQNTAVIRSMPNTPALLGYGAIAITKGKYANVTDLKIAEKLLCSCGVVVTVPEKDMDAVTAVSGSGPAYIFYIAEIMRKTARKMGLSANIAKILVDMTLLGASSMLITSEEEPEVLRQRVTSKGGTTEAAFKLLFSKKLGNILEEAIISAKKRSKELAKKS